MNTVTNVKLTAKMADDSFVTHYFAHPDFVKGGIEGEDATEHAGDIEAGRAMTAIAQSLVQDKRAKYLVLEIRSEDHHTDPMRGNWYRVTKTFGSKRGWVTKSSASRSKND